MLWFEDSSGNVLNDLGDNPKYHTIKRFEELKKEYKALIEKMWLYVI